MVSTTVLGKIIGINAKLFLFEELLKRGYIVKPDKKYQLTELGQSNQAGGRYRKTLDGNLFPTWPIALGTLFHVLKESLLDQLNFRLFHMTHINNLESILEKGIFSHNKAPADYFDISDPNVNSRRKRDERIHKKSLHDYTVLYFNSRNAMLYRIQHKYKGDIVLIEISKRVCLSNYTIFTEGNAASEKSKIVYCPSDVKKFDWTNIRSRNWVMDGVENTKKKQLMQSECLVYNHIDINDLISIHIKGQISSKLKTILANVNHPGIHTNSDLFF